MTQEEHLDAIERHLTKLLEIAKERTPGAWAPFQACGSVCVGDSREVVCIEDIKKGMHLEILSQNAESDAIYIAACAGNAEAGWEALLAFTSSARRLRVMGHNDEAARITHPIIEMFPVESLTYA